MTGTPANRKACKPVTTLKPPRCSPPKPNQHRQAHLNLRLARTYLMATDPLADKRTWQMAMEALAGTKRGTWGERWQRAIKQRSFDVIRDLPIMDSQAEHLLKVLRAGTVSTNVYLRRIHNFVLDMGWLACPLLPKRQWPAVHYKENARHHAGGTSGHIATRKKRRAPGLLRIMLAFGRFTN